MEDQKKNEEVKPEKKQRKRIFKWILAIILFIVLLIFFALPIVISSDTCRKKIIASINGSVDGKVDFASLKLGWFKGIEVRDISFNDDIGSVKVNVNSITTKPHYGSLLAGSLSFGKTVIDKPEVAFSLKSRQTITQKHAIVSDSSQSKSVPVFPLKKIDLRIKDGIVKITDDNDETVEFSSINSRLDLRPPGKQTTFDLGLNVGAEGNVSEVTMSGSARTSVKKPWTLKGTSGDLLIDVNDFDLASLGSLFALASVDIQAEGKLSVALKGELKDGNLKNLTGSFKAKNLNVTGEQLKGDSIKTSLLDIAVQLDSDEGLINIGNLDVKADWLSAKAGGRLPTTITSLADFIKADTKPGLHAEFQCDVAAIASQMPRIFGIKEGLELTGGTLTGKIEKVIESGQGLISGQAKLAGLAGTMNGKKVALSEPLSAELKIRSKDSEMLFDKLDVSSAFCKISCTGSTKQMKYDVVLDLAKLQSELQQFVDTGPYAMAGQTSLSGTLFSEPDKIGIAGLANVKNLKLTSAENITASEPKADIKFTIDVDTKKQIVTVNSLNAQASFGNISTSKAIFPFGPKTEDPMELALAARIDLEKLQPFAVLLASLPPEMEIAGVAESQLKVSAKKNIYKVTTDATKIENLKLYYPQRQPFIQDKVTLVMDAVFDTVNKTIAVDTFELTSPQIKTKFKYDQKTINGKTSIKGKVDLEYDWAAINTIAAPYLPPGLKVEGLRKDSILFETSYPAGKSDQLIANLTANGKLGFDSGYYMGLNFGPTEVNVGVEKGLMTLAPFSTTVNKGKLNFAGQADFNQKPTMLKTPQRIKVIDNIQINDDMSRQLLMHLNPIFAGAANVTGFANFDCEQLVIPLASNAQKDIKVIGTISLDDVQLSASDSLGQILTLMGTGMGGQKLAVHPTRFVLEDGFLSYDDMQIDIGNNPLNFKGTIGLDNSLEMSVTLPYTYKGKTAKVDRENGGKRISLPFKGTADKPELDTGKLIEEQIKERLFEGLGGLLKG